MAFETRPTGGGVRFRLRDREHEAVSVRLWLDLGSRETRPMTAVEDGWELDLRRPPVDRLEYLFVIDHGDGAESMQRDPANPLRVPTAFGDHSVIEFAGYRRPHWLDADAPDWDRTSLVVRAAGLRQPLTISLCGPPGRHPREALPLLLVHDGPEFDALGSLTRFSAALTAAGRLPEHRLALLSPGDRNAWYAASADYAAALRGAVLPAIRNTVATRGPIALAGASLGALAALHAAHTHPGVFAALFLQSGSFFRPTHDAHESGFAGYPAIVDFVAHLDLDVSPAPMRVALTCGLGEENLANNRLMAESLVRAGHYVRMTEVPDAHNYTAWRDALDPCLVDLLAEVWW
ncbi:MAG: esterase [Actinobacteria bacterium]|nr:esterase [Actinomycetota bacterium]